MTEDHADRQLVATWQHFASWKEKIFAGYLVVLGGLGISFFGTASQAWRILILGAAVVVSVVFWLLDYRTGQLLNACQVAASQQNQDRSVFAALNETRFTKSTRWTSYGFAIDLLVGAVTATSLAAVSVYWARLPSGSVGAVAPTVLIVAFPLIVLAAQMLRTRQWNKERTASTRKR